MSESKLLCPECGCDGLLVYEKTSWDVNTGEFYCHSVKAHDSNAEVRCQDNACNWVGQRSQLVDTKATGEMK